MREKKHYTRGEITNNLYTFGSEWVLTDNTEYIGLYHKYTTGEVYTQATWDKNKSVPLIPYEIQDPNITKYIKLKPDIKTSYKSVLTNKSKIITATDRQKGFINRYFIQNLSSAVIYEVDNLQFKLYNSNKLDTNLYNIVVVKWHITGNIEDSYKNSNVFVIGVKNKNKESIRKAKKKIPGLSAKLTNLLEFYADTEFIVPADINSK